MCAQSGVQAADTMKTSGGGLMQFWVMGSYKVDMALLAAPLYQPLHVWLTARVKDVLMGKSHFMP